MNETFERFMRAALAEAKLAASEGEVPVGAVLVKGGEIVARAHNKVEQTHDATAHAELLCLRQGMELLGARLTDCTLFVTLEPCAMCAGACVNAKLGRLVYGAFDDVAGCCGTRMDLTDHCFLHTVETWGGVLETDCKELLSSFFKELR
ncbi:tRNA-specific adenosine deaminase [bioreactor metagenome]|uniref:tRNA(adenine(34)) deaminase n=1 Tax=bioreactor metagenome TaxID=1076179 RepID=A0A644YDV9_9ZZZZ